MERIQRETDGGLGSLPNGSTADSVMPDVDGIPEIEKIKKRVSILIEQGDWTRAVSYCEKRLDSNPEDPELYFLICLLEHRIPDESAALDGCCDILNDTNFKIALKYATPERRMQMDAIARTMAVDFYLKQCMDARGIQKLSLLPQSNMPLGNDKSFLAALQIAEMEWLDLLLDIQREQCDYFLGKCMEANHASDEAGLVQCENPLVNDSDFKTALLCAAPDDREHLYQIQYAQSDDFLRKCLEKHGASEMSDLERCRTPLRKDPCFQNALLCASPEQAKKMNAIADRQSFLAIKRRIALGGAFAVFITIVYLFFVGFRPDLQIGARLGMPAAQYQLGCYYDYGGAEDEAMKWYLKAAKQNYIEAQYQLGITYLSRCNKFDGECLSRNHNLEEALSWFLMAAEQNDLGAQIQLGELYYTRLKDLDNGRKWFQRATENGMSAEERSYFQKYWIVLDFKMQERIQQEKEKEKQEKEM